MSDQKNSGEPVAYLIECEWLASTSYSQGKDPVQRFEQSREVSFNKKRRPNSSIVRNEVVTPLYTEQPAPVAVVLSADELRFLEAIALNPGAKLNCGIAWNEEGDSMWGRLEDLGLIECVGGYKWKLAFNAVELGVRAFLGKAAQAPTSRPTHATPPPGTESSGTHPHNDGLDEMRKPVCCGSCPGGCVIQSANK